MFLAHLSDPHLAPLPTPNPLRTAVQARARLSQLAAQAARDPSRRRAGRRWSPISKPAQPDHIAVTGDLVNLSLTKEFATGARLAGKARRSAHRHARAGQSRCLCARGRRPWPCGTGATYMRGDAGGNFPFVRRRGPLALIGLSTSLPTPPLAATGHCMAIRSRGSAACWRNCAREQAVSRGADPSSAGRRRTLFPPPDATPRRLRDVLRSTARSWCCTAIITARRWPGCRGRNSAFPWSACRRPRARRADHDDPAGYQSL